MRGWKVQVGLGSAHASSVHLPQPHKPCGLPRDGAQQSGDHVEADSSRHGCRRRVWGRRRGWRRTSGAREVLGVGVGRASPLSSHRVIARSRATSSGAWQRTLLSVRDPVGQRLSPCHQIECWNPASATRVTSAFRKSAIASKNSSYVRTVSGSLIAGTKPGLDATMPSLISSRHRAGQPTAAASAWASVVLPGTSRAADDDQRRSSHAAELLRDDTHPALPECAVSRLFERDPQPTSHVRAGRQVLR